MGETHNANLDALRAAFPWPAERPNLSSCIEGWNTEENLRLFQRHLGPSTRLIVELGVWLGQSTLEFVLRAPHATVVCVDHWRGSQAHHVYTRWPSLVPRLNEAFVANLWEHRHRIIILSETTLEGLQRIGDQALHPDFIYVDAGHGFEEVQAEVSLSDRLFPNTVIAGDDFDRDEVRRAVAESAPTRRLHHGDRCWWLDPRPGSALRLASRRELAP